MARLWSVVALVALPLLVAAGCGVVWLERAGYVWHFAGGCAVAVVLAAILVKLPVRPHGVAMAENPTAPQAERDARAAVAEILDTASADDLSSLARAQDLALRTVRAVAQAYHPNDAALAIYTVTVPELLLMTEDVSRRLTRALDGFPVLRHLEIDVAIRGVRATRHAAKLWKWGKAFGKLTPEGIVAGKLKTIITREMLGGLGGGAKARLAAVLAKEIGAAAIRLYSGEYRRAYASGAVPAAAPPPEPGPLTILFAGVGEAGKSTLLNALVGETKVPTGRGAPTEAFTTVALEHAAAGRLVLIDSPGLDAGVGKPWLLTARNADLVVWVAAANRADRARDQQALAAVRRLARDDPRLRDTPIILAATHADLLSPPLEWQPPYDPETGDRPKERTMRDALAAVASALEIPVENAALVALAGIDDPPWNVAAVWARIHAALPEAKQKQLERGLRGEGWSHVAADTLKTVLRAALR